MKFRKPSSNISFEEYVLSNLIASTLMKPCFTPGGSQEIKCVNWKVSVGLYWVLISKMESFANLSPLNIVASRKVIWFSDISAVNLIVQ